MSSARSEFIGPTIAAIKDSTARLDHWVEVATLLALEVYRFAGCRVSLSVLGSQVIKARSVPARTSPPAVHPSATSPVGSESPRPGYVVEAFNRNRTGLDLAATVRNRREADIPVAGAECDRCTSAHAAGVQE
jgi:hypothetical protein